ncbi:hypothetical protein QE152_g32027 [Popillia japonica]|uniref:Uncharacterized protein n=1 Tax=Popillia japonica TaxID=7064 RepID=A0AAW1J0Z9_POPJA
MFNILKRRFSFTRIVRNGKKDEFAEGNLHQHVGTQSEDEYFYKKSREEIERLKHEEKDKQPAAKSGNDRKDYKTKN